MESQYTWLNIGKGGSNGFLEIMGAPISEPSIYLEDISRYLGSNTTLCIGGELKTSEEGKPASNFRYEKDHELNSNVIKNYIQLFRFHKEIFRSKPIFVTTIPRSWRKYSWLIKEDGEIVRKDQDYRRRALDETDRISYHGFPNGEDEMDIRDEELTRFLSYNCIEKEQLIKLRECCKGARYHTYLADMISFLYQLRCNDDDFSETFYPEYRELLVINDNKTDKLSYKLCFEKSMNSLGYVFLCPKKESVNSIYHDFGEAISLNENPTKEKIRNHLLKNKIHRWTDFSENDTDDAFTILMMIHAFNGLVGENNSHGCSEGVYYKPSDKEKEIVESLHESLEHWRSQL